MRRSLIAVLVAAAVALGAAPAPALARSDDRLRDDLAALGRTGVTGALAVRTGPDGRAAARTGVADLRTGRP
ncbi:MAG TPA: hypothetical protein VHJ17_09735, partial [Thermomonospora sp.]|nr:hypothetical protein [Thermomonospora sp.]